jgi:hypothetical protein
MRELLDELRQIEEQEDSTKRKKFFQRLKDYFT